MSGIIANVNGAGFPVAYLLFETRLASSDVYTPKAEVLIAFFERLKPLRFQPKFIFSDKDAAQISARETTWSGRRLRLCIWHMQRAIDQKLAKRKVDRPVYWLHQTAAVFPFVDPEFRPIRNNQDIRLGIICPQQHRKVIIDMVTKHYHLHPLIPTGKLSIHTISYFHYFY